VKPGREGPTIPVQLCGGLRSPNKTVAPAGTTTIYMAGGAACIDNAPDTSSMARDVDVFGDFNLIMQQVRGDSQC
jgi:hypothetical protein